MENKLCATLFYLKLFTLTVRYANRADVILLFFDPDKPGTTGETLSILTNSLIGMEHKLHIILNKSDQFRKIHDFARAYGSLCWNLSKVIQRKDLPRIYTMCLPPDYRTKAFAREDTDPNNAETNSLGQGLLDLQTSREDVVQEVMNAPRRRVDNEITRLNDSLQLLKMHCQVLDNVVASYRASLWRWRFILAGSSLASVGTVASAIVFALPLEITGSATILAIIGNAGLFIWQNRQLHGEAQRLASDEHLHSVFQRIYSRRIAERDEFVSSLWVRVREHLKLGLRDVDVIQNLRRVPAADLTVIDRILDVDVPNLRRKVGVRLLDNSYADSL